MSIAIQALKILFALMWRSLLSSRRISSSELIPFLKPNCRSLRLFLNIDSSASISIEMKYSRILPRQLIFVIGRKPSVVFKSFPVFGIIVRSISLCMSGKIPRRRQSINKL